MPLRVDFFHNRCYWQSIILTVDVFDSWCFKNRFFSCWCNRTRCFGGAPFFTYKICYLCLKWPILSRACANIRREYSPDSPTFANLFCSDLPNSPKFASGFAWTRQTRRNSPKAIFEKNVTRLAKFARVIRETCTNFASSHCLIKSQN